MARATLYAPCGIDCAACDIYVAAHDRAAAERLAESWRSNGHPDAGPDWFQCRGCRRHIEKRWCGQCGIYDCSVGEKGLVFCADCCSFPCQKLEQWAAEYPHHQAALERLIEMSQEYVGTPPPV